MLIREAVEADLPSIQSIYAHYVLNSLATFEEERPSVEEIALRCSMRACGGLSPRWTGLWSVMRTPRSTGLGLRIGSRLRTECM